jgi:hypothetical protein
MVVSTVDAVVATALSSLMVATVVVVVVGITIFTEKQEIIRKPA